MVLVVYTWAVVVVGNMEVVDSYMHLDTWVDFEDELTKLQNMGIPLGGTWTPLHLHPHFNPVKTPARGLPWNHPSYKGVMKNIHYKDLDLPVVNYYCPKRILELYVHPPCDRENISSFAEIIQ